MLSLLLLFNVVCFDFSVTDANGFIGGNKTYEGALAMAKGALTIE